MKALLNAGRDIALEFAKPTIFFYTLIWMMIILILGTVAQKYVGLYTAQNAFFYSAILWAGPIPLPGGLPTMALVTLCLTAKLALRSDWSLQNSGIIISHIGALLLLLGGFLTFAQSKDGNMVIFEGEKLGYFSDYHERQLVIEDRESGKTIARFPWRDLKVGRTLTSPDLPDLRVDILKSCRNCDIFARTTPKDDPLMKDLRGRAVDLDIAPTEPMKDDEMNRSAVQFRLSGTGTTKDGIHFTTDFIDLSPSFDLAGKSYNIALRKKRTELPFEIELVDFKKITHPGTDIAKSYSSEVILRDNGTEWRSLIQMNEPLRYRGYTFYQSSFLLGEDGREATVLAVVKNAGRLFPYISSIVMCIGLLIHMALQLPLLISWEKSRRATLPAVLAAGLFLAALFSPPQAFAEQTNDLTPSPRPALSYSDFAQIPVLDEGRVKPLDTMARSRLEEITGKDHLPDMSAIEWLSELIFTPDRAYRREVFNLPDPRLVDAMELNRRPGHRYSYHELAASFFAHKETWKTLFDTPQDRMTASQRALMELYEHVNNYALLSRSLTLISPDFIIEDEKLAQALGVKANTPQTFFDLRNKQPLLQALFTKLVARAKTQRADAPLAPQDRALIDLIEAMKDVSRDTQSDAFRIIPPQWNNAGDVWFSPWQIAQDGEGSPASVAFLRQWQDLTTAYRAGDTALWDRTARDIRQSSLTMAQQLAPSRILSLETLFNLVQPFKVSFVFYFMAFACVLGSFLVAPRSLRLLCWGFLLAGLAFHTAGLGARMIIMQRPPVTNLYGSIIFVGLIAVAAGLVLEARLRQTIGLLVAATLGTFLQLIGLKFDAEGDTMGMLVAVLDTNFWLATHVVMMTIGYSTALVGAILGHAWLGVRLARPANAETSTLLFRNMRGVVLVAIFFSSLGTILGGIWADQSWGRFWGWDPKENGALLLVLWLLFVTHGRLSGKMGEAGFCAAMAFTTVVIALAWFGVNLLGVGLHSYGFTQSAALGFVVFCSLETLLIGASYLLIRQRAKKSQGGSA